MLPFDSFANFPTHKLAHTHTHTLTQKPIKKMDTAAFFLFTFFKKGNKIY